MPPAAAFPAIELTDTPDPMAREAALRSLLAYNEALLGPADARPLALLLRSPDGQAVTGGLWGRTAFQWLFVELLFVPENLRGRHVGAALLQAAEAEARERGCIGAWLDTFNPSAREFYRQQGYETFGEIGEYPPGHGRYFLHKRFRA